MRAGRGNSLQIILKVAERCNIACTYCYFFFGGDDSHKFNPAFIGDDTVDDLAAFVEEAIERYRLDLVRIIIHGGEPLMLKRPRMERLLGAIAAASKATQLQFTIQTNAMLVDEAWIELFERFNVYVGVSIDGPREANDTYRLDKRSRGTYDRTIAGLELLRKAHADGRIARPGALCVVNPELVDAQVLYGHLVRDLEFHNVDFLLPDDNHDSMPEPRRAAFRSFMLELFECYRAEKDGRVTIRFFNKLLYALTMKPFFASELQRYFARKDIVFTVSSAGDIAPDDILRMTDPQLMKLGLNIRDATLADVLRNERLDELADVTYRLPTACGGCEWSSVCRGGDIYHRYRRGTGFDNPSIYCDTLKALFERMAETAVDSGMPVEAIDARLKTPLPVVA
nr:radical SAM protein [Luteibacter yeojuensis]